MAVSGLQELAPGVFVFAIPGVIPVNAGIVVGADAVAVIDTGTTEHDARALLAATRTVTERPVRYVINTHHHGDHSFGNWWFRPALMLGHTRCRLRLVGDEGEAHRSMLARLIPVAAEQIEAVPVTPPDLTFDTSLLVQLGDVALRLDYFGRAHTNNDIAVGVVGRGINFAGDLIEEAGPPMAFEAFPAEWGATLRRLEQAPEDRFVPGHGRAVERGFVGAQAQAFEDLSEAAAASADAATALARLSPHGQSVFGGQAPVALQRYFADAASSDPSDR